MINLSYLTENRYSFFQPLSLQYRIIPYHIYLNLLTHSLTSPIHLLHLSSHIHNPTGMLLLFVLMGAFAGFSSARLYKTFKGKQWQRCTLLTATLFPGTFFLFFFLFSILYGGSCCIKCVINSYVRTYVCMYVCMYVLSLCYLLVV